MKKTIAYDIFCLILVIALLVVFSTFIFGQDEKATRLSVDQWLEDLKAVEQFIEKTHPNPWTRISKEDFQKISTGIRSNMEKMNDAQRATALMRLTASIRDGHTELRPFSAPGFDQWFPVRFYAFFDGLRIVSTDEKNVNLLGAEVLRIGSVSAEEAVKNCGGILGADNEFGVSMKAPMILSNAGALLGLGIIEDPNEVNITVRIGNDEKTVTLTSNQKKFDTGWFFGSLSDGPLESMTASVFSSASSVQQSYLARNKETFWLEILEDGRTMFVQINAMRDGTDESFGKFVDRMYTTFDERKCNRLIIDIRFNTGGNNELARPILYGIIKRDIINRRGGLFVFLGQRTFSAAIGLLGYLVEHTNALLVGSPPRAPLNAFGDADAMRLPNSRMLLICSTLFHQKGSASDNSRYVRLNIAAPMLYADVKSGTDSALNAIKRRTDHRTVAEIFINDGAEEGLAAYKQRKADAMGFNWVNVYNGRALHGAGYSLLGRGRVDDAIAAFRLNAQVYPDIGFVWDALADGLLAAGDVNGVIDAAKKLEKAGWRRSAQTKLQQGLKQSLEKKDISAAQTYTSYAIETYPETAMYWVFKGQLAELEGDTEEALKCYRKALAINNDLEEPRKALARLKK